MKNFIILISLLLISCSPTKEVTKEIKQNKTEVELKDSTSVHKELTDSICYDSLVYNTQDLKENSVSLDSGSITVTKDIVIVSGKGIKVSSKRKQDTGLTKVAKEEVHKEVVDTLHVYFLDSTNVVTDSTTIIVSKGNGKGCIDWLPVKISIFLLIILLLLLWYLRKK